MDYHRENRPMYRGWPNIRTMDARAFPTFDPSAYARDDRFQYGRRPDTGSRQNGDGTTPTGQRRSDEKIDDRGNDRGNDHRGGGEGEGEGRSRFVDYLFSTTGFQGPGKIREAPYTPLKILWLLAFLAACAVMILQLVQLFEGYFLYPTKMVVKLQFSPLPLPALTLCNVNPIRQSFARNLSCPLQQLMKIPQHLQSQECTVESVDLLDLDYSDYYCSDCGDLDYSGTLQEDLDSYALRRDNIAFHLGNEPRETRRAVGHQIWDLVVGCSLFGRSCPFRNVTSFLSRDYGNCYTFSAPKVKATKSGPEAALLLTLNLETEEFVEGYKTGYGVRVVVHEHGTTPFPSTEGFTISSGFETEVALIMTEVKRKGGRYGKCDNGRAVKAVTGFKYTIATCRENCLFKSMLEQCKCVDLLDEGGEVTQPAGSSSLRVCTTLAEYKCLYKAYDKYVNITVNSGGDACNCQTPCEELIYSSTLSSRTWPVLSHIPVLEEQVCKLSNFASPKCDYLNASFTPENVDIRRGFARLRIFYDRLNYEILEELPFYDTERFLSDIGGTLGLWIGVTALGLVELFELALLAASFCRRLLTSRRTRR